MVEGTSTVKTIKGSIRSPFHSLPRFHRGRGEDLRPQYDKTEAVTTVLAPPSKKLLKAFLGLVLFFLCLFRRQLNMLTLCPTPSRRLFLIPFFEDLLALFKHLKDTILNPHLISVLRTVASS